MDLTRFNASDKQHLWGERPQPARCRVYWWDSSWLDGYAYSTLPVKGEESLVSSTASSASEPRQLHKQLVTVVATNPVGSWGESW